jgi:hypothetical protein
MQAQTASDTDPGVAGVVQGGWEEAAEWFESERRSGTVLAQETLWREAFLHYEAFRSSDGDSDDPVLWAALASFLVFDRPGVPRNECEAAREAVTFLQENEGMPFSQQARCLREIAEESDVDPVKILGLLGPGIGYPWMFPRSLWNEEVVAQSVEALLASLPWKGDGEPEPTWISGALGSATDLLERLEERMAEESDLARIVGAVRSLVAATAAEGKDLSVREAHAFIAALEYHGLSRPDIENFWSHLSALRWAVVLVESYRLYLEAERALATAQHLRDEDPSTTVQLIRRAANVYKRLCVAQLYPERLLERHQEVHREMEEVRREHELPDERSAHMVLISTFNSPADLQRLLLSLWRELTAFGYGHTVHVIVSDDSTPDMREQNRRLIAEAERAGMSVSHWDLERKNQFLDELNAQVFPDGSCDVRDLAGPRKPGEKGIPYGRFRNFLRLVALKESRELGLDQPISTWLDQDNEIGALVLTRSGTLSKRHVFNYFDQKAALLDESDLQVAGGGYTNDALEGVEKFWVAWGVLHHTFELAHQRSPDEAPKLPPEPDITRFRPWDQSETLERLPREGEQVETFGDQVYLLMKTVLGTFRGKYDNQVEIYHPWTFGYVRPGEELLVEETRAFAGMPGGNTSFAEKVLASPIPFITVGGRGEDIFHLWQVESEYGVGSVALTHTPALHTRNVSSGRSDLLGEIVDSFNGRILREPPYLWDALARLAGEGGATDPAARQQLQADTEDRINNLRAEAMSTIAAVSGFATALDPYLDESKDFWWLRAAKEDPRYAEVIGELRDTADRYRDAERAQQKALEKLLTVEDVTQLTDEFIRAYPHWRTVVQHVTGGAISEGKPVGATARFPFEGYAQARPTAEDDRARAMGGRPEFGYEPTVAGPTTDPAWREIVQATLLLFRKYEHGTALADVYLRWSDRVARLRQIYERHAALAPDLPDFVWTIVYRDALLVPHSAPYLAVSRFLSDDFIQQGVGEKADAVPRVAEEFGVERELLEEALGLRIPATAGAPAA